MEKKGGSKPMGKLQLFPKQALEGRTRHSVGFFSLSTVVMFDCIHTKLGPTEWRARAAS